MTRPTHAITLLATAILLALAGCGATSRHQTGRPTPASTQTSPRPRRPVQRPRALVAAVALQALVTAQTENRLLVVNLPSGRVLRRVTVPGEPDYVAATRGVAVVVSSHSGTVTLLDRNSFRLVKMLRGFASPHIPAISPDGNYAYVTDDQRGQLTVVGLDNDKIISKISVGGGAHHLAFSPDQHQVWIALGQSARTISILSTITSRAPPPSSPVRDAGHPHLIARFEPGFLAHDLLFTPDGRRVWITSANTPDVGVFSARTHRLLFRVPAGRPPQHVAFRGRFAYVTSGYGASIEQVALDSGRVLRQVPAPYGSFDLDATANYVVTSSLFLGTLTIYDAQLHVLHIRHLAPSAEDVTIPQP